MSLATASNGAISVSAICDEFVVPRSNVPWSKLYRGTFFVSQNNSNVPASGRLNLASFRGARVSTTLGLTVPSVQPLALSDVTSCNVNLSAYMSDANIPVNSRVTYTLQSNLHNALTLSNNVLTVTAVDGVESYTVTIIATNRYGQSNVLSLPIQATVIPSLTLNSAVCPPLAGPLTSATFTTGAGTFIMSASQNSSSAFQGFNYLGGIPWSSSNARYNTTTGNYTGPTSTSADSGSNAYAGEWVQIELPGATTFSEYVMYTDATAMEVSGSTVAQVNATNRAPMRWSLLGSMNGSNWTTLDSRNYASRYWTFDAMNDSAVNQFSMSNTRVKFLRLVINRTNRNSRAFVNRLSFHPTTNVISSVYPRNGMRSGTMVRTEGTYTATESSFGLWYAGWNLFDFAESQYWMPDFECYSADGGDYIGSNAVTTDVGVYSGEWAEIQMPMSIKCKGYSLSTVPKEDPSTNVLQWAILGSSNNGASWVTLDTQTVTNSFWAFNNGFFTMCNFPVLSNADVPCSRMRIVVNKTGGGDSFQLGGLYFYN